MPNNIRHGVIRTSLSYMLSNGALAVRFLLDISSEVPSLLGELLGIKVIIDQANSLAPWLMSSHIGAGVTRLWLALQGSQVGPVCLL